MRQIEFRFILSNDEYEALPEDLLSNIRDYIFECVKSDVVIDVNEVPEWFIPEFMRTADAQSDIDLTIPY